MCQNICKYVEHWAGEGNPPKYLTSLAGYLKTVKKVFCDNLTQEALRKVNALDFGFGKGGHVRMWVLKAILGRSNLNAADFSKLTSANGMTLLAKGEEELNIFQRSVERGVNDLKP